MLLASADNDAMEFDFMRIAVALLGFGLIPNNCEALCVHRTIFPVNFSILMSVMSTAIEIATELSQNVHRMHFSRQFTKHLICSAVWHSHENTAFKSKSLFNPKNSEIRRQISQWNRSREIHLKLNPKIPSILPEILWILTWNWHFIRFELMWLG